MPTINTLPATVVSTATNLPPETHYMPMDSTMISAIIAAAVSFLTLAITVARDRYVKQQDRKRHANVLLRYLSSLVHSAVIQAEFHIVSLKTYMEALNKNPFTYTSLTMTPKPDLEAIATKLTEEQYFNSYVDKYKNIASNVEEIKVIFSSAVFINGQLDKLHDRSNYYYAEDNKKHRIISEALQEVVQKLFELQVRYNATDIVFNKFFSFATGVIDQYSSKRTSPTNVEDSYNLFISPMVEATIGEFSHAASIVPLINPLRTAKNTYHSIEIHCRSYCQEIQQIQQGLTGATKQMKEAANHLIKDYPIVAVRGRNT